MQLKELVDKAEEELEEEKINLAKDVIKERLVEINQAERVLAKLKAEYNKLLGKDVEDVVDGYTTIV